MAAPKKSESMEVAVPKKSVAKKPSVKKPKVVEPAAPAAESVAVPAEMLSQLMSQLQTLTQEVGELRSQVQAPNEAGSTSLGESEDAVEWAEPSQASEPSVELAVEDVPEVVAEIGFGFSAEAMAELGSVESDDSEEDAISPEEAGELLAGFDEAMSAPDEGNELLASEWSGVQPEIAEEVRALDDEVSAEVVVEPVVDASSMSDEDIARAIENGAVEDEGLAEGAEEEIDDDLDDLTEADLVAMIRQNIEEQGETLDERAAAEAEEAEARESGAEEDDPNSSVMSAVEIAALLKTPDQDGDLVPSQSAAMSDDELLSLLSGAGASASAKPNSGEVSFVKPKEPVASGGATASPAKDTPADEAELGAIKAVPANLAIRAMALPVRFQEGKILFKVAEPVDRAAIDRLSKEIGLGIIIEATPIEEVVSGLRIAYAEFQDFNARSAVISGAQKQGGLVEKISNMWKKSA